jgi:hypothetical protein
MAGSVDGGAGQLERGDDQDAFPSAELLGRVEYAVARPPDGEASWEARYLLVVERTLRALGDPAG